MSSSGKPIAERAERVGWKAPPVGLAIALDVDDPTEARRLARAVAPTFGIAKVGLELFSVAGPPIVEALLKDGFSLFVDLKLYDIPATVERAARALGRLGTTFATVHAAGGVDMVRAAVAGLGEGASERGFPPPIVLGITVLTSEQDAPASLLAERVDVLVRAGAGGLVCAAPDLVVISSLAPELVAVVPGIRFSEVSGDDQSRTATPEAATRAGADVLVIGRPITRAPDPAAVAGEIAERLANPHPSI